MPPQAKLLLLAAPAAERYYPHVGFSHFPQAWMLRENESTYIPVGTKHRLENPGIEPLSIIEVQSGSYLGEDDIVRFDDVYGRSSDASAAE